MALHRPERHDPGDEYVVRRAARRGRSEPCAGEGPRLAALGSAAPLPKLTQQIKGQVSDPDSLACKLHKPIAKTVQIVKNLIFKNPDLPFRMASSATAFVSNQW